MTSHQFATIKVPRLLYACLCAVLLCSFLGVVSDTRAQLTTVDQVCTALDISTEDCAVIDGFSTMPPAGLVLPTLNGTPVVTDVPWFAAPVANQGSNSLRSGNIDDDQASCLVLEITLSADTLIRFSLRTSSQGFFDRLAFFADNQPLVDNYSAAEGDTFRDWEQQERFLLSSVSSLTWCYAKDSTSAVGADSVWLDTLSFETFEDDAPLTQQLICQALDTSAEDCSLILPVGSSTPPGGGLEDDIIFATNDQWQITADASAAGGTSLRSRDIDDDQSRCLGLNTPLLSLQQLDGLSITVAIRTSSEGQVDSFEFRDITLDPNFMLLPRIRYHDFSSADAGSTERDWALQTYYLPPDPGGNIAFCYRKDSEGEEAAWIDRLSFDITNISYKNRICETLDLTDQSCAMIESIDTDRDYLWAVATETSVQGGSSLRSRGEFNDVRAASSLDLTDNCFILFLEQPLPGPTRIHYSRRINAEIDNVRLLLTINDSLTGIDSFSAESDPLRDWEQGQFVVAGDVSSLTWCYVKDSTSAVSADSGWIDALSFVTADLQPLCDALDLTQTQCVMIRSATYEPPQNLWLTTTTAFIGGDSALVSPPLETGQSACLTLDIDSTLPSGSYLAFSWRVTSPSDLDIFEFQAGGQQSQLRNMPQWQTEVGDLNGSESTLRWCYRLNSTADSQTARAWLDNLFTVVPDDRYVVQIAVTGTPTTLVMPPDRFRFQVTVTAQSPLLSTPTDWVLVASGIANISAADSTYALVFSDNSAQVDVTVTPDNSLLPSSVRLVLADRPLLRGVAVTSMTVQLPAIQLLQKLNVDDVDANVSALDLIVAMRWLADQQQGNSEALVANLAIDSASITAAGINNLQQLFNENSNSVDLNKDGRADQLDLRILLRWLAGLRGAELAEQEVVEDIVRLLLGKPPISR